MAPPCHDKSGNRLKGASKAWFGMEAELLLRVGRHILTAILTDLVGPEGAKALRTGKTLLQHADAKVPCNDMIISTACIEKEQKKYL